MAVAIQLLPAKRAYPAGNIEGNQHMVACFQVLHHRPCFLYCPGKFMAEGHANPGIGHKAVV
jgi:hypothetical protein